MGKNNQSELVADELQQSLRRGQGNFSVILHSSPLALYCCKIVRKTKCRINPGNNGIIVCILCVEYLGITPFVHMREASIL